MGDTRSKLRRKAAQNPGEAAARIIELEKENAELRLVHGERIVSCVNALSGIADPETWVTMCKELTAFMSRASTENNDDPVRLLIRAIHAAENGTK